jgi:hypothetical protein
MSMLETAHRLMLEHQARTGERSAEARARRRLLALARHNAWPAARVHTPEGDQLVAAERREWERCARTWSPAAVVSAMHVLYLRTEVGSER